MSRHRDGGERPTGAVSPVSFAVSIRRLPNAGMPIRFAADERERAALAEAHGLTSVERFEADLLVKDWKRGGVRISGRVAATIEQPCVVTLEPVVQDIDEEVDALFVPAGSKLARPHVDAGGEMLLQAEGPDAPETFEGDTIDAGALAEEIFALAIDPYPHVEGAAAQSAGAIPAEDDPVESPFARLKEWSRDGS